MNQKRCRRIRDGADKKGPVVYWMSRDQRTNDNWALLFSEEQAKKLKSPLSVVFSLAPDFLGAGMRQYLFMLEGLMEVEQYLRGKGIPFFLLRGPPEKKVPDFLDECSASLLVTDFSPLRIKREWTFDVADKIDLPFYEVDSHNIVPCWVTSDKCEYAAYTLRPKLRRALPEFLDDFPALERHPYEWQMDVGETNWSLVIRELRVDPNPPQVDWIRPGEKAARDTLKNFLETKLPSYETTRNDISKDCQSNLSPYLHFGQIAPQRVALEVLRSTAPEKSMAAFLEELTVRKELSDNFCYYNLNYDRAEGFPGWSKGSLNSHRSDIREYLYTLEELERSETHDEIWNAAEREMVVRGKMHGYMRMYWAKKILEWTESPEDAMRIAIYLNDKYELDGRDPNGYTGISWSIGGVHDRAWRDRLVTGKVRYMSQKGLRRKFDVDAYIKRIEDLV